MGRSSDVVFQRDRNADGRFREVRADQHVANNKTIQSRHRWLVNGLQQAGLDMNVGELREAASRMAGRELSLSAAAQLPKAQLANVLGAFFATQSPAVAAAIQAAYQGARPTVGAPLKSVYDLPPPAPPTPRAIQSRNPSGWQGRVPRFELGQLPEYHPDTREALDRAFDWDKAGEPKTALKLYEQVLLLEPDNADALNRKALAEKHLAAQMVSPRAKHNESASVRRDAVRTLEKAVAGFQGILDRAREVGMYDPEQNTVGFASASQVQDPERRGLLGAVPKALYNLAVAQLELSAMKGGTSLGDDAVLAAFSRAAHLKPSVGAAEGAELVRRATWSSDDPYSQQHASQVEKAVGDAVGALQGIGGRLRDSFLQDPDLKPYLSAPALRNAIEKGGAFAQ